MGAHFHCGEVLSRRRRIQRVVETGHIQAFHLIHPYWPEHTRVIPRQHTASLLVLIPDNNSLVLEGLSVTRMVVGKAAANNGECHVLTNLGHHQDSRHLHRLVSSD